MSPSFARLRQALFGALLVSALSGCASLPPPTGEMAAAQEAVSRALGADASQYAAAEIAAAQATLSRAQAALSAGRDDEARRLAVLAAADADLARARSQASAVRAIHRQRQVEVAALAAQLQAGETAAPQPLPPEPVPATGGHALRLQALAADVRLTGLGALERLQAQQAVDAAAAAPRKQRADAEAIAERRVAAAEAAAYAQALQRDSDRLEREFNDLQLEATRREAATARAEAERLRLEAQVRAEETERLRREALAQEQARQQAEQALRGAATEQTAKLDAAREKELALAREEAELVAGAKLPPVRREERGDVFTLGGEAFASGQASLTPAATASLKALAGYLALTGGGAVRVEGHSDSQGDAAANQMLSQRRADAVRKALVAAGMAAGQVEAIGQGSARPVADNATAAGRWKNRRVEIVVARK